MAMGGTAQSGSAPGGSPASPMARGSGAVVALGRGSFASSPALCDRDKLYSWLRVEG